MVVSRAWFIKFAKQILLIKKLGGGFLTTWRKNATQGNARIGSSVVLSTSVDAKTTQRIVQRRIVKRRTQVRVVNLWPTTISVSAFSPLVGHVRTRYIKHPKSVKPKDSIFLKNIVRKTFFAHLIEKNLHELLRPDKIPLLLLDNCLGVDTSDYSSKNLTKRESRSFS